MHRLTLPLLCLIIQRRQSVDKNRLTSSAPISAGCRLLWKKMYFLI